MKKFFLLLGLFFIVSGFILVQAKSKTGAAGSGAAIIFDGTKWPTYLTTSAWNNSSIEIVEENGSSRGTKAVKWVQGQDWTGIYADLNPAFNLKTVWTTDTCKIRIKSEAGVGAIRFQMVSSNGGKYGKLFTPAGDNQWHDYAFPLRELIFFDGSTMFETASVSKIELMAEGSGITGKTLYITDWWIGTPEFDTTPPGLAKNVNAITGEFQNLVTWQDVEGEELEKYDIYCSKEPITDISAAGVDVIAMDVNGGIQIAEHVLRAPINDQKVTYYYAVICKDASGNVGQISESSPGISNTAKGVPTISLDAPVFNPDGNLSEWAAIKPFRLKISEGSAYLADNTKIDNDADLSAIAYVAIDNNYLYVAFDVEDDQITPDISTTSYLNDSPDLFIGLYDWHGKPHTSFQAGPEADVQFRFSKDQARVATAVTSLYDSLLLPGENYFWGEKFPTGYTVEARIPLDSIPARIAGCTKFTPKDGQRLPIDFSINDADGKEREGILCYSKDNNDRSAGNPSYWTYTWIGEKWTTGVNDNKNIVVNNCELLQNYPNPFNPSTQIAYTLKNTGMVTVKVYDVLGKEIATLVNQEQESGLHTINFDASNYASGIYIYKITAGSFTSSKKMLFLK